MIGLGIVSCPNLIAVIGQRHAGRVALLLQVVELAAAAGVDQDQAAAVVEAELRSAFERVDGAGALGGLLAVLGLLRLFRHFRVMTIAEYRQRRFEIGEEHRV